MRLPKQLDQIFQLANEFHNDESYPIGMTVDEGWIYTGDVAGVHELLLCSDPSFVECRDGCDELPDGVGVIMASLMNAEMLWYPSSFIFAKTYSSSSSERRNV